MTNPIVSISPLGFLWETEDPFLFCANHDDEFPIGNQLQSHDESLKGRRIGSDFVIKDGYRMYHGETVPGFPSHPHRGFETITIVLEGLVDHFDSLGGKGRYGNGDVQWMTAGKGIQHSEMFPLVNQSKKNKLKLFQLWLNLPSKNKMVEPNYIMFWNEKIPKIKDNNFELVLIAGSYQNQKSLSPPKDSWAADINNNLKVFLINLKSNSSIVLPSINNKVNSNIYFYKGDKITINGIEVKCNNRIKVDLSNEIKISTTNSEAQILFLSGLPIQEPVAQAGPFVMNTQNELSKAFSDYRETEFGGWPWDRSDPVNNISDTRFAQFPNKEIEKP